MAQIKMMAACREFFGYMAGQTAKDFMAEYNKLTNEDRKEIAEGLAKNGFDIDPETILKPEPKAVA